MSGTSSAMSMYSRARIFLINFGGVGRAWVPGVRGADGAMAGVDTVDISPVMVVIAVVAALKVGKVASTAAGGTTPIPMCNEERLLMVAPCWIPGTGGMRVDGQTVSGQLSKQWAMSSFPSDGQLS